MPPSRTVLAGTGLNPMLLGQAMVLQRLGDDPCVLEGLLESMGTLTNEWEERRTEKYQGRQRAGMSKPIIKPLLIALQLSARKGVGRAVKHTCLNSLDR